MSHDEALKRFQADGTILDASCDPEYLDLRTLLDDPAAQSAIGKFASSIKVLDVFMCWIDIQEYKAIPTDTYRRSKALHIFQKYIKAGAVLDINLMTPGEVQSLHNKIEKSRGDASVLNKEMYNKLQYRCFESIYSRIYQPFKQTVAFQSLTNDLRFKYNRVKLSHFEYFGKLGEGGFGFVVHCKKKSTGECHCTYLLSLNHVSCFLCLNFDFQLNLTILPCLLFFYLGSFSHKVNTTL